MINVSLIFTNFSIFFMIHDNFTWSVCSFELFSLLGLFCNRQKQSFFSKNQGWQIVDLYDGQRRPFAFAIRLRKRYDYDAVHVKMTIFDQKSPYSKRQRIFGEKCLFFVTKIYSQN